MNVDESEPISSQIRSSFFYAIIDITSDGETLTIKVGSASSSAFVPRSLAFKLLLNSHHGRARV